MGQKSCIEENKNDRKHKSMPDINWTQNPGYALILSLFTISVILQPLLSKFSFLINLVSRNSSFSLPLFLCVSWQIFLLFSFSSTWSSSMSPLCSVPTACHTWKLTAVVSCRILQGWWNGFHQLTTCLDHNVARLWQHYPIFLSSHFLFLWVTLILVYFQTPSSSKLMFCCRISFFIVSQFCFVSVGASMHEVNDLYLERQPLKSLQWGSWHRDVVLWFCSLNHFIVSTRHAVMLFASDRCNFFVKLFVSAFPFECF